MARQIRFLVIYMMLSLSAFAAGSRVFSGAATDKITSNATYTWPVANTWCFWLYRTSLGGGSSGYVFQKLNTTTNVQNFSTNFVFTADWNTSDGDWRITLPASDTWHHIAITYNATAISVDPIFYVNGSAVSLIADTNPTGTTYNTTASSLVIGNNGNSNTRNYGGSIAYFRHYNTVLTAGEILTLATTGVPPAAKDANRLRHFPLNGTASPEPDSSTAADTGILTGTAEGTTPPVTEGAVASSVSSIFRRRRN